MQKILEYAALNQKKREEAIVIWKESEDQMRKDILQLQS